ncbi:hypothetical protein [Aureimonas jatrophae]|uniref:Uncharacterized protein n=1 Tax=Aureimonas jatrophae TaxID=1166073 RepID=A0A1H0HEH3_9HYPH|nr:hypothetical protein [Aureimonas jatrophae]MBB3950549.1 hypothetical protein [Aureimonas jatrophae]SDO17490.1 hypothetical protein SAMN05192530_10458 [Aureimonas jatrophae]
MTIRALAVAAALLAAGAAQAHEPRKGPNGGTLVDAGSHHVELVAAGTEVKVFVSDISDAPLAPDGFKGTAVVLVGGKPTRVTLAPAGGFLSGTLAAPTEGPVKGAVQLTGPDGKTSQAKFD